jgi:hypothetical protein
MNHEDLWSPYDAEVIEEVKVEEYDEDDEDEIIIFREEL